MFYFAYSFASFAYMPHRYTCTWFLWWEKIRCEVKEISADKMPAVQIQNF